jgi:hypothetical protein
MHITEKGCIDDGGVLVRECYIKTEAIVPHGSNGSISITATLILYNRSGHKLIKD